MNVTEKQKAKSFNDWAYLAIDKHTHKFIKHEAAVLEDKDTEQLHQMRVGMRKLRAALVGFDSVLNLPKSARQKKIGKIARKLGKLRDLDVLIEAIEQKYKSLLPEGEKQLLNEVIKQVKNQRKNTFKLVKSTLKGKKYLKVKNSLRSWLKKPKFDRDNKIENENVLDDLLLSSIDKLLKHEGWFVGIKNDRQTAIQITDNFTPTAVDRLLQQKGHLLHELRKEAKRCRYQMELFTQFYGKEYQKAIDKIKTVQTVLGNLQDDAVFQARLTKITGKKWSENMPILAQKMQENRYRQWQEWQKLQTEFLSESTRQDLLKTVRLSDDR